MSKAKNRDKKDFYVYEHWRPDKNIVFYVGLGTGRRCNVMYKRDMQHDRIQKKLARQGQTVEVRIIASGLTREEAATREIERIAYWLSLGVKLVNRTSGGESGYRVCDETRELQRQRKIGKKLSTEHRAKIAAATRIALSSPEVRARISAGIKRALQDPEVMAKLIKASRSQIRTPEHNAKIAAAHKGKKLSPEHAAKSRMASIGRKQTPEEIERRRKANTGKKRTPEFCQQMRELNNRSDIKEIHSRQMKELNTRPDVIEANRLRTIARNKAGAGKKRGPYRKRKKIDATLELPFNETVH